MVVWPYVGYVFICHSPWVSVNSRQLIVSKGMQFQGLKSRIPRSIEFSHLQSISPSPKKQPLSTSSLCVLLNIPHADQAYVCIFVFPVWSAIFKKGKCAYLSWANHTYSLYSPRFLYYPLAALLPSKESFVFCLFCFYLFRYFLSSQEVFSGFIWRCFTCSCHKVKNTSLFFDLTFSRRKTK